MKQGYAVLVWELLEIKFHLSALNWIFGKTNIRDGYR
jgi:hypothetical protein